MALMLLACAPALAGDEFLAGGDISALAKIEEHGGVFHDRGASGDAIEIMSRRGCNTFRLRLFVDPTGDDVVVNDLPYTIALAGRVKSAGAKLLLDFHYSDTWADPSRQTKPAAWASLSFDSLEQTVRNYTRDAIAAMTVAGVEPDLVQVGNEIDNGILWPDGKLYGVGDPQVQWDNFARLLKAGIAGVRDAGSSARIVMHTHEGGNWSRAQWFINELISHGVEFDVIGLSFYPWWHGKLADFENTVRNAALAFGKDVLLVETTYPWRPFIDPIPANIVGNLEHPTTPQGQRAFLSEVLRIVRGAPNGRGLGILWWYPESIPVEGLFVWHGGAMAMFDSDGNALPAFFEFRKERRTDKRPHQTPTDR